MIRLLPILAVLLRATSAIFADEAYDIDYHYALLGEPQESTTFFHRPNSESRASLIYTLSEQNGLGALNPKDGSVVWRHLLQSPYSNEPRQNNTFLRAADGGDVVVSGVGDEVTAWSSADGKLAWTYKMPSKLEDIEILEGGQNKDTIALSSGSNAVVVRLDGATGNAKWSHVLTDSDAPYQLSASASKVYLILLHKTLLGYFKIKVVSLDPATGNKVDEYTLSSENELTTADSILSVGANSASPIIAWTDAARSVLKVNVLGSKNINSFSVKQHEGRAVEEISLHAPYHANSVPHFLAHYKTAQEDWAEVYHIDIKSGKVEKAYSLPTHAGRSAFSTATIDVNVYFTRINDWEVITVSSASHGILGRWEVTALSTNPFDEGKNPVFAISELSVKADKVSAIRSAVWLSSGELILLRDGAAVWSRPEALADTVRAKFTKEVAAETIRKAMSEKSTSNPIQAYVERVTRHLTQLYWTGGPNGMFRAILDGFDKKGNFGFEQTVLCQTRKGQVFSVHVSGSTTAAYTCPSSSWATGAEDKSADVQAAGNASTTFNYGRRGEEIVGFADENGQIQTWTFTPKKDEHILDIFPRPVEDPVASIGVVLGNRKVLYKYLNPNLALVVTANDVLKSASFFVLDTVSGAILHTSTHQRVDLSMPIVGTMSESWFAYSFTAESSSASPKGHHLVTGELFESLSADDRGVLDTAQTYSSFSTTNLPFVLTQMYHISEPISHMAVTRTAQGITSRQLLAVLPESDSIIGIPRSAIDPRRPNRDPTKDEQMEGLVRYNPSLEFDARWYLNHKREVLGIEQVLTSPAVLESTSLIFAFGFDVFSTRLSPSFNFDMLGKDFNKFQMLATVLALAVATFIVGPLVMRKQVNTRWSLHA